MAASLFSKPASALLENGRLFGSAQTRNSSFGAAAAGITCPIRQPSATAAQLLRRRMAAVLTVGAAELEHQQLAPAGGVERQVLSSTGEAKRGVAYARIDLGVGHDSGPAADARENGDILLSVRAAVGDRLTDEAGACAKLPKHVAVLGVDRLEQAVHGAVEGDIAGGYERAAPDRKVFVNFPGLLARHLIPRH